MICTARSVAEVVTFIIRGNGFGMLASLVSAAALICLFVSVTKYHDSEDMSQWPAIFMTAYLAANLFLIIGVHWSYVLLLLPIAAMVLLMTFFNSWWVPGVSAGVLMIMLNFIIGIILFKTDKVVSFINFETGGKVSSLYIASLFLRQLFLMGVACICYFCSFPSKVSYGDVNNSGLPQEESDNGFI